MWVTVLEYEFVVDHYEEIEKLEPLATNLRYLVTKIANFKRKNVTDEMMDIKIHE